MLLLGYDVGSSSIKAALLEAETGRALASAVSPEDELVTAAPRPGWAEQDPDAWWGHVQAATAKLRASVGHRLQEVQAIGLSYQMHGLVIVDEAHRPLRPAIIWSDSRAVDIGEQAFQDLGSERCLARLLNAPGNFTASKLKWVREHEPEVYARIHRAMLPGDFLALRMTGELKTTPSGLSEAILWDVRAQGCADFLLDYYGIDPALFPEVTPTFSEQGVLTEAAARALDLKPGIPVAYRAGDQPNNALALNVLRPGELAATAGTSGVIYGVSEKPRYDAQARVNTFLHVNHTPETPRYGVLMCVNGAGILNSWLKQNVGGADASYEAMNERAARAPIGTDGLVVLPFGNGAERTLENRDLGAIVHGLRFTTHDRAHLLRASQEGIVFALHYGLEILREMGLRADVVRAGHTNLFRSPLFAEAFATVTGRTIELYETDGAQGAARGAGLGSGAFKSPEEAFVGLQPVRRVEPDASREAPYREAYAHWRTVLRSYV